LVYLTQLTMPQKLETLTCKQFLDQKCTEDAGGGAKIKNKRFVYL
jgi:hypothetical protein